MSVLEKNRTVPLTGPDIARQAIEAAGLLLDNEIHTTSDNHRVFMEGHHVGPVWHGTVVGEAEMIGLYSSERSVFPMDECYRSDTKSIWKCIANRGQAATDWYDTQVTGGIITDDILDGGPFDGDFPDDITDGGDFVSELDDEVDGGDFTDEDDFLDGGSF